MREPLPEVIPVKLHDLPKTPWHRTQSDSLKAKHQAPLINMPIQNPPNISTASPQSSLILLSPSFLLPLLPSLHSRRNRGRAQALSLCKPDISRIVFANLHKWWRSECSGSRRKGEWTECTWLLVWRGLAVIELLIDIREELAYWDSRAGVFCGFKQTVWTADDSEEAVKSVEKVSKLYMFRLLVLPW